MKLLLRMTSINPHPTMRYDQPEDYHFSHDSIFLARKVFELVQGNNLQISSVLDLCSGCGIVGIDFIFHLKKAQFTLPRHVDFLEVQEIYKPYFEKNVVRLDSTVKCSFINENYKNFLALEKVHHKYDLIISNPPYFREGHGTLSKSEFKNRCRFFIDANYKEFILSLDYLMANTGKAFILVKSLDRHGIDVEKEMQQFTKNLTFKKLGHIRATDLFEINKT